MKMENGGPAPQEGWECIFGYWEEWEIGREDGGLDAELGVAVTRKHAGHEKTSTKFLRRIGCQDLARAT